MKEKAFLSVVLYVSDNAGLAGDLLLKLDRFMDSKFENFEIIVVNDASTDSSAVEIRDTFKSLTRDITMINLAWKHGPEKGMLSGVDLAIGDFVVEMDLNRMDYDLSILSELFLEASKGFDVVAATRSRSRRISDILFFSVFNRITYLPFKVINETIRIVSRRAINSILDMDERVIYRGILYKYSGFPSKTIQYQPVKNPKSKGLSIDDKINLAIDVLVSYSNIGTNISVVFATFFMMVSLALGLYATIAYFMINKVVQGWTTTILFMSICFFGVFAVIGLQGRYISAVMYDIKRRPTYIIRTIERSSRQTTGLKK